MVMEVVSGHATVCVVVGFDEVASVGLRAPGHEPNVRQVAEFGEAGRGGFHALDDHAVDLALRESTGKIIGCIGEQHAQFEALAIIGMLGL